jgi:hypothetical protein
MTRKSVGKWISKALAVGAGAALKDAYHRPKDPRISEDAKAWVVHLACCKPKGTCSGTRSPHGSRGDVWIS